MSLVRLRKVVRKIKQEWGKGRLSVKEGRRRERRRKRRKRRRRR